MELNNIIIRDATIKDKDEMHELLYNCFGYMIDMPDKLGYKALDYEISRYKVTLDNNKIIAISGLLQPCESIFRAYEISWTCTMEKYRKQGLIVKILREFIDNLPDDGIPIYCDCWRLKNSNDINLKSVMNHLGFKLEILNRNIIVYPDKDGTCKDCSYKINDDCMCHVDLYKLNR